MLKSSNMRSFYILVVIQGANIFSSLSNLMSSGRLHEEYNYMLNGPLVHTGQSLNPKAHSLWGFR